MRSLHAVAEAFVLQLLAVAALAVVLSCGGSPEIDSAAANDMVVEDSMATAVEPGDSLVALYEIGGEDSFGSIDGVLVVGESRLAVLDRTEFRVSLVSKTGEPLSNLGRAGRGPGEFFRPVAFERSPHGDILVLDQGLLRLTRMSVVSDSLRIESELRTPLQASDMCLMGERVFLLGSREGMLLHEIDAGGNVLRSFAESGEDPIDAALATLGRISCSEEVGAIAYISQPTATLRIFSPQGRLLVSDSIPGYVQWIWQRPNAATVRRKMPPEGFIHYVSSLSWFQDQVLILLARYADDGNSLREGRLYSVSQGTWRDLPRAWPDILALSGDTVYSRKADPYPVIQVYEASR